MSGKAKFALWLLMGLVLSACGQRVGLAPVVHGGNGETVPPGSTTSAVAGQTVTVQRGDALYKIARRYNIGLRSLIDANDLKPPYTIFPGQKLSLPSSDVHVVRRAKPSIKSPTDTIPNREHWFGSTGFLRLTAFTPGKRSPCLVARGVRHQQRREWYRRAKPPDRVMPQNRQRK